MSSKARLVLIISALWALVSATVGSANAGHAVHAIGPDLALADASGAPDRPGPACSCWRDDVCVPAGAAILDPESMSPSPGPDAREAPTDAECRRDGADPGLDPPPSRRA